MHFEGSLRPDNSTGPQPLTSTCVGKISLDPNAQIKRQYLLKHFTLNNTVEMVEKVSVAVSRTPTLSS